MQIWFYIKIPARVKTKSFFLLIFVQMIIKKGDDALMVI